MHSLSNKRVIDATFKEVIKANRYKTAGMLGEGEGSRGNKGGKMVDTKTKEQKQIQRLTLLNRILIR